MTLSARSVTIETPAVQARRRKATTTSGETHIAAVQMQLRQLREDGILIDVDSTNCSIGKARSTFADWGISARDAELYGDIFTPGYKILLPKRMVNAIKSRETRHRQIVEKYGRRIPGLWPYWWVPYTAYIKMTEEINKASEELRQIVNPAVRNYDALREAAQAHYAAAAARAWTKAKSAGKVVTVDGETFSNQAAFVDFVVAATMDRMPTVDDLRQIKVELRVGVVITELDIHEEQASVARSQAEAQAARVEYERLKAQRAAVLDEAETARHAEALKRAEAEHKSKAARAAVAEAQYAEAVKQLKDIGNPLNEAVQTLMGDIETEVNTLLERVQYHGHLPGKSADLARSLTEYFDLMRGGLEAPDLRAKLEKLAESVGPKGEDRRGLDPEARVAAITASLRAVKRELKTSTAAIIEQSNSRFARVKVRGPEVSSNGHNG